MTNDEVENNSNLQTTREIDWIKKYNLPYEKTEWGLFYSSYREQGQLQLSKQLEKYANEYKPMKVALKDKNINDIGKLLQHFFYKTQWNEATQLYETPSILLRHSKRKMGEIEWNLDKYNNEQNCCKVIKSYHKRFTAEYNEVKLYYKHKKVELERQHKEEHKQHANEEVVCPFCSKTFLRTNLSRHKKTNKKCLEIQSKSEE